jgi:hypothetical protein
MVWNRKVKVFLIVILFGLWHNGYSQGVVGFFTQKQTQTQYLAQQIAALKVYASYLQKGYEIVDGGLNTIGDIKGGHLKLDRQFFEGLTTIHQKVRSRAIDVLQLYSNIEKAIAKDRRFLRRSTALERFEKEFAEKVYKGTEQVLKKFYDELNQLLDGSFKMTDDERLIRVEGIYIAMNENYQFLKRFSQDIQKMEIQKQQESKDVKILKRLYP